eukprot:PITA_07593
MFKDFKVLVEKQIGKQIKILRFDNGGEFTSNDFFDFWKEVGIRKETTIPYNTEQNGFVEKKNKAIMEAVKALLHDKKLAKLLRGEAVNTAFYVENRSPHGALNNKTPEEVFIGEMSKVGHLRIFGCPVYFYVPKQKWNKLEDLGKKARDTAFPFANVHRQDDAFEIQEGPESELDLVDEPMEPIGPLDPPPWDPPIRKRPLWLCDTLQDADRHVAPRGTFRGSKKPCWFQGYIVAMSNIIQAEPCTFEEAVKDQVWKDAMAKEYESIIHNDVWEIVPRPKAKSIVTSKWLYKTKHGVNGSIEKYKAKFVARGFS